VGTSAISITSLTATAALRGITLVAAISLPTTSRDVPSLQLDNIEFYASQTNDVATAAYVGEGNLSFVHTGLREGDTWYYWAKPRAKNKNYGAIYPATSTGVKFSVPLSNNALIGGLVVATASAGSLIIAIKQLDGVSDPTAANPVSVQFVSPIGAVYIMSVTTAWSITIAAGAKIRINDAGIFFNGSALPQIPVSTPFQLYLGATDNGDGTVQLSVACPAGIGGIRDTFQQVAASSGAGGDIRYWPTYFGAAGNTGTANSRTLARLTWPSGLASYSNWTAPTSIFLTGQGSLFSGDVVQKVPQWDDASSAAGPVSNGTGTIAFNAVPTWANGDLLQNYGFQSAGLSVAPQPFNIVEQDVNVPACLSVAGNITLAYFNYTGSPAGALTALKAVSRYVAGADQLAALRLYDCRQAGASFGSTMSWRIGGDVASTWRVASTSAVSPVLGGVESGRIINIREIMF
jgi:hypothetical protein